MKLIFDHWQRPDAHGMMLFNTLRPRQNGRHCPDDIFTSIFLNENVLISLNISLKLVADVRINNIPALVQIMAWRRPGDKPLSKPMMAISLTHICITRPQWVKRGIRSLKYKRMQWRRLVGHQHFVTQSRRAALKCIPPGNQPVLHIWPYRR